MPIQWRPDRPGGDYPTEQRPEVAPPTPPIQGNRPEVAPPTPPIQGSRPENWTNRGTMPDQSPQQLFARGPSWGDFDRVMRWKTALDTMPAGTQVPDWVDPIGVDLAWRRLGELNTGKPWYLWNHLGADDPVFKQIVETMRPEPVEIIPVQDKQQIADTNTVYQNALNKMKLAQQENGLTAPTEDQTLQTTTIDQYGRSVAGTPVVPTTPLANWLGQPSTTPLKADYSVGQPGTLDKALQDMTLRGQSLYDVGLTAQTSFQQNHYGMTEDQWAKLDEGEKSIMGLMAFVGQSTTAMLGQEAGAAIGGVFGPAGSLVGRGTGLLVGYALSPVMEKQLQQEQRAGGGPLTTVFNFLQGAITHVEKGLGTMQQLGNINGQDLTTAVIDAVGKGDWAEVEKQFSAAYEAGGYTFETAYPEILQPTAKITGKPVTARAWGENQLVPTEGALNYIRKEILSGKSMDEIEKWVYDTYGVYGQATNLLSQIVLDPLNHSGKILNWLGVKGFAKANPVLSKAFGLTHTPLKGLGMYGTMLNQMPMENAAKYGKFSKWLANIDNMGAVAAASRLGSDVSALRMAEPNTLSGVLAHVFGVTPASRSGRVLQNASEGIKLFAHDRTPEQLRAGLKLLAKATREELIAGVERGEFPSWFLSSEAEPIMLAMRDLAGTDTIPSIMDRMIDVYTKTRPQAVALDRLGKATGEATPESPYKYLRKYAEVKAEDAKALFDQEFAVQERLAAAGDEAAKQYLATVAELQKTFIDFRTDPGGWLKKTADLFWGKKAAAFDEGLLKTNLDLLIADKIDDFAAKWFKVKPQSVVFSGFDLSKRLQSYLLLGYNPTFLMNNTINNYTTMMWDGLINLSTRAKRMKWLEEMGISPLRMRAGANMMDIGHLMDEGLTKEALRGLAKDELKNIVGTYELGQNIRKAGQGKNVFAKWNRQLGRHIPIGMRWSQVIESMSSEQATHAAMRDLWPRLWRPDVGFDSIKAYDKAFGTNLEAILRSKDPDLVRQLENYITNNTNSANLEAEILSKNVNVRSINDYLSADDAALLGKTVPDAMPEIDAAIRTGNPDTVRQAFTKLRTTIQDEVAKDIIANSERMTQEVIDLVRTPVVEQPTVIPGEAPKVAPQVVSQVITAKLGSPEITTKWNKLLNRKRPGMQFTYLEDLVSRDAKNIATDIKGVIDFLNENPAKNREIRNELIKKMGLDAEFPEQPIAGAVTTLPVEPPVAAPASTEAPPPTENFIDESHALDRQSLVDRGYSQEQIDRMTGAQVRAALAGEVAPPTTAAPEPGMPNVTSQPNVAGVLHTLDAINGTRYDFWVAHHRFMDSLADQAHALGGKQGRAIWENGLAETEKSWNNYLNMEGSKLIGTFRAFGADTPTTATIEQLLIDTHTGWATFFETRSTLINDFWQRAEIEGLKGDAWRGEWGKVQTALDDLYDGTTQFAAENQKLIDHTFATLFNKQFGGGYQEAMNFRTNIATMDAQRPAAMMYFRSRKPKTATVLDPAIVAKIDEITGGKPIMDLLPDEKDAAWERFMAEVYQPMMGKSLVDTENGGGYAGLMSKLPGGNAPVSPEIGLMDQMLAGKMNEMGDMQKLVDQMRQMSEDVAKLKTNPKTNISKKQAILGLAHDANIPTAGQNKKGIIKTNDRALLNIINKYSGKKYTKLEEATLEEVRLAFIEHAKAHELDYSKLENKFQPTPPPPPPEPVTAVVGTKPIPPAGIVVGKEPIPTELQPWEMTKAEYDIAKEAKNTAGWTKENVRDKTTGLVGWDKDGNLVGAGNLTNEQKIIFIEPSIDFLREDSKRLTKDISQNARHPTEPEFGKKNTSKMLSQERREITAKIKRLEEQLTDAKVAKGRADSDSTYNHANLIKQALVNGEKIPQKVLDEYPEIAKRYTPPPETPKYPPAKNPIKQTPIMEILTPTEVQEIAKDIGSTQDHNLFARWKEKKHSDVRLAEMLNEVTETKHYTAENVNSAPKSLYSEAIERYYRNQLVNHWIENAGRRSDNWKELAVEFVNKELTKDYNDFNQIPADEMRKAVVQQYIRAKPLMGTPKIYARTGLIDEYKTIYNEDGTLREGVGRAQQKRFQLRQEAIVAAEDGTGAHLQDLLNREYKFEERSVKRGSVTVKEYWLVGGEPPTGEQVKSKVGKAYLDAKLNRGKLERNYEIAPPAVKPVVSAAAAPAEPAVTDTIIPHEKNIEMFITVVNEGKEPSLDSINAVKDQLAKDGIDPSNLTYDEMASKIDEIGVIWLPDNPEILPPPKTKWEAFLQSKADDQFRRLGQMSPRGPYKSYADVMNFVNAMFDLPYYEKTLQQLERIEAELRAQGDSGADLFANLRKVIVDQIGGNPEEPVAVPPAGLPLAEPATVVKNLADLKQTSIILHHPGLPESIEFEYRIVPLDKLITSENPLYPTEQGLQARTTDRAFDPSMAEMYNKFNPMEILQDQGAQMGTPLVKDGIVEAGNGRISILRRFATEKPQEFQRYQTELANRLSDYGLTPKDIEGVNNPILVRERVTELTPDQRRDYTTLSNTNPVAEMSAAEKTMALSAKLATLAPNLAEIVNGNNRTAPVRVEDFSDVVLRNIGTEQYSMVNKFGLTPDGRTRIQRALFDYAYGAVKEVHGISGTLLDMIVESGEGVTYLRDGIMASAPMMAKLKAMIDTGLRDKSYEIAYDVGRAVQTLLSPMNKRKKVERIVADRMNELLGLDPNAKFTDTQIELMRLFQSGRSAKRITNILNDYVSQVIQKESPRDIPIFEVAHETAAELLKKAIARNVSEEAADGFEFGGFTPAEELTPERASYFKEMFTKLGDEEIKKISGEYVVWNRLTAEVKEIITNPAEIDLIDKWKAHYNEMMKDLLGNTEVIPPVTIPPAVTSLPEEVEKLHQPPITEAKYEGMLHTVLPKLDEIHKKVQTDLRVPRKTTDLNMQLTPEEAIKMRKYLLHVKNKMADAKMLTMRHGQNMRDFALLNYSRRYGWDNWLGAVFPYQFWYTRSMGNWMIRAMDKPSIAANYMRLAHLSTLYQPPADDPTRLQGKLKIPMPFLPKFMGDSIYADPLQQFFPFMQIGKPFEQIFQEKNMILKRAKTALDDMVTNQEVMPQDAQSAWDTQSGPLWEKVMTTAKTSIDEQFRNPMDIASSVMGFSVPLSLAYNLGAFSFLGPEYAARPEYISQLPITRTIQNMSAALGIGGPRGINIEEPIRKLAGLPAIDRFEDYRVDRMLAGMAAEKVITTDQALRAMIDRVGPVFQQAQKRVSQMGLIQYVGAPIGVDFFPEGEQDQRALAPLYDKALEEWKNGDGTAYSDFMLKYPEYAARLASFKDPEQRLQGFLRSEIWTKWNALPDLYKRQYADQFGTQFTDLFLNKETRNYSALDTKTLGNWAQALGSVLPESMSNVPTMPLALADKKTAAVYQDYVDQRKALFPDLTDRYAAMEQVPADQQQFVKDPILEGYTQWRYKYLAEHPEIIPWVTSQQSNLYGLPLQIQTAVYRYRADKNKLFPGIDDLQTAYYALPVGTERKNFLKLNLDLNKYWDWRKEFAAQYPQAAPWIISAETLSKDISAGGQNPETQAALDTYYTEKDRLYPGINDTQAAYFSYPSKSTEAKAFLAAHPELTQYWDWHRKQAAMNTKIAPYIMSEQTLGSDILGKTQYQAAVGQDILQKASPELLQAIQYAQANRKKLGSGALSELYRLWKEAGEPGDFNAIVKSVETG